MTPAGTSNELDVQNEWEEKTHTTYEEPVFEIVHDESVKVYLRMYNGNVQQNPLCVKSCVTKEFCISPRFSPTIFDPDANSVFLRAHLYSSGLYTQKTLCSKLFKRA